MDVLDCTFHVYTGHVIDSHRSYLQLDKHFSVRHHVSELGGHAYHYDCVAVLLL